jgi:hypothetical protein
MQGQHWRAIPDSIHVWSRNGRLLGKMHLPGTRSISLFCMGYLLVSLSDTGDLIMINIHPSSFQSSDGLKPDQDSLMLLRNIPVSAPGGVRIWADELLMANEGSIYVFKLSYCK